MTPWLSLSLSLWLGQAPTATDEALEMPPLEISTPAAAPSDDTQRELERLRTQVEALQTQLEAQEQEASATTEIVQLEVSAMQERAQEQERLRIQRLALLESASQSILAADQSLAQGELDVDDSLDAVDSALAQVLESAEEVGRGQTVLLVESARDRIAFALSATGGRDVLHARWALYFAYLELREARRHALNRPDTFVLTP